MNPTYFLLGLAGVIILYLWFLYNSLITAKVRIREAWSQIEVQLKRRSSLIPNLIQTVKGYAKHEKAVFENVTKARSSLLSAKSPKEAAQAENVLTGALKSLFAIAEAYPQLRASENFSQLAQEISDTETKIAASRQFYNANVLDYNTKIKIFPNVIIANLLNFREEEFFDTEPEAEKEIKVDFEK